MVYFAEVFIGNQVNTYRAGLRDIHTLISA